jgi:hypothetical protein
MVSLLLELSAPSGRVWIVSQPAKVAMRDAALLLARVLLLTACTLCRR